MAMINIGPSAALGCAPLKTTQPLEILPQKRGTGTSWTMKCVHSVTQDTQDEYFGKGMDRKPPCKAPECKEEHIKGLHDGGREDCQKDGCRPQGLDREERGDSQGSALQSKSPNRGRGRAEIAIRQSRSPTMSVLVMLGMVSVLWGPVNAFTAYLTATVKASPLPAGTG